MKIVVHVPVEQFGFVSAEYDTDDPKSSYEAYNAIADAFKPQPSNSLPTKDFNKFIDNMLLGESNHISQYEQMSPKQIEVVQEIKKALKRIK